MGRDFGESGDALGLFAMRPGEPGDFGFLVYPLTIVIAALPGGIAGGLIGLEFRGQIRSWDHCWP